MVGAGEKRNGSSDGYVGRLGGWQGDFRLAARWIVEQSLILACLALAYAALRYLARFSETQTLVLMMLGLLLGRLTVGAVADGEAQRDEFRPFRVHVEPNWLEIFQDFGLLRNDQSRDAFREAMSQVPAGEYHPVRSGFNFTAIGPKLFYWHDRDEFSSRVDFTASIPQIQYDREPRPTSPQIRFKEIPFGYALQVVTPESCQRGESAGDYFVSVNLLPCEAFDGFWRRQAWWERKLLNAPSLSECGWSRNDCGELVHRYCEVRCRSL